MKTIGQWLHKKRELLKEWSVAWSLFREKNFGDTDRGLYWLTTLLLSFIVASACGENGLPYGLGFLVVAVVTFLAFSLLYVVLSWILRRLLSRGIRSFLYGSFLLLSCTCLIWLGSGDSLSFIASLLISLPIALVMYLFARGSWALFGYHRVTIATIATTLVSSVGIIIGLCFLVGPGYQDTYVDTYLESNASYKQQEKQQDFSGFLQDTAKGEQTALTLEYGIDGKEELESKTVNLENYAGSSGGIQGWYRRWYQGYSLNQVPLAGKVYYPSESKNCPVLFLIHGNHNFVTKSYLGYDHLGEYLASHGYVVVSVDENSMNSSAFDEVSGENDARAILLLENIKQLQTYNEDPKSPLYQKMDYENLAIAGHSRGGEAVSIAALFNQYDCYPHNGNLKFNYHFNIRSVLAIAPTVNQYRPADHEVALKDINYLLIQGANDQDVSVCMGTRTYNQLTFSGEGSYFKSSLYFTGANHGQFNELWGKYDWPYPIAPFLNVANFMSEKEQQNLLCIFSKVFLDVTLQGKDKYADLFSHCEKYESVLPKSLYLQSYENSSFQCIADYEEDSDLTTTTDGQGNFSVNNLGNWTEGQTYFSDSSGSMDRGTYACQLMWTGRAKQTPAYVCRMKNTMEAKQYLQLDFAQLEEAEVNAGLNAKIVLVDERNHQVTAAVRDYVTIYPPLPIRLGKLQYLCQITQYRYQDQTIRIPVDDMTGNSAFDAKNIKEIRIEFPGTERAKLRIDNLGFSD